MDNTTETNQYHIRLLEEYKKTKETVDSLTKRQSQMKSELVEFLIEKGYEDDKGHRWASLGDEEIKYERRVQRSLNLQAAEIWAKETGRWEEVKEVLEVVNEDRLLGLAWVHKDLESIIQGFYVEKEIWAFKV